MKDNRVPSHHGVKSAIKGKYPNETLKLLIERASLRNFSDKRIPPRGFAIYPGSRDSIPNWR